MNSVHPAHELFGTCQLASCGRKWRWLTAGATKCWRNLLAGITDYLDAIARLAPLIAEHRETFDSQRRLPDVVFNALADAGLFRLWLPEGARRSGTVSRRIHVVVEAASALDGSVGWLVGNGAGMSRVGGYLPEPLARQFFSDPRSFVVYATGAVGIARKVEGGYRVTGRWPFGSGAHHASHFMGLASTKDADGKDEPPLCCYFERRDVAIHDTWRVSGLRATGSCDFEVRDLFVPEQHTHDFMEVVQPKAGSSTACLRCRCSPGPLQSSRSGSSRGLMNAFVELASRKARQGATALYA